MCGFAGMFGGDWREADASALLGAMARTLVHRGPDDDGLWSDATARIGRAHRRLSVLDLSAAGHQPMGSHGGRFMLAYNGEIYNHLALHKELERAGAAPPWRGHSDTETLLAGFEHWGVAATITRAVGMFAFAVWDRQQRRLLLARDRLGEKPLYYGWQGAGAAATFLFGSELRALKSHPVFAALIDRQALSLYMRHSAVPGSHAIHQGIYKLAPGSLLSLSMTEPVPLIKSWWSGATVAERGVAEPFTGSDTEAVDTLEALLTDAVGRQMVADVPLGAFLSGGVDSSTVVALMQAQSARPVRTYSIGFSEAGYDEAAHAQAVARHLGTEHTELYVTAAQAQAVVARLPSIYDEPFADPSQIPTFLVSQLARRDVTVSLSGDGGDELFAGYNRHRLTADWWPTLSALPMPLRRAAAWGVLRFAPGTLDRLARGLRIGQGDARLGEKLHKAAGLTSSRSVDDLYLGLVSQWSDPASVVVGGQEACGPLGRPWPELASLSDVQRMMALDMLGYLSDDILTKVDRAAMAVSLETRVPLLDPGVVAFAWRLPMHLKLRREGRRTTSKWALRQVLYRHVPRALIERPKMGFGVPINAWLRGPLRDWAEALLDPARLAGEGFFEPAPVRQAWEQHLSGRRDWQYRLWCVLMFQSWLEANHQ